MLVTAKSLSEILIPGEPLPPQQWDLKVAVSEQCLSYLAFNTATREALLIDPKEGDQILYEKWFNELKGYRFLGVINTHTHADHISCAAEIALALRAPFIMHEKSPSQKVELRVSRDCEISASAAPVRFLVTPGHTADGITPIWGPYIFGGDTLLFCDTGRDDLPGGDPAMHFESLEKIKACCKPEHILLTGHDHRGGRASTWGYQLTNSPSLSQSREDFVREAAAFEAPAPKLLKESLKKNFI